MADREKKEWKTNVQNCTEYLENGKSFLGRIKNIFHIFKGLLFGEK